MKNDDLSRELINILDQTTTLVRQDLVTIRNDVMMNKLELARLEAQIEGIRIELDVRVEERKLETSNRTSMVVGIGGAIIAAVGALVVALIKYIKN